MKTSVFIATSLDGYIARPDGSVDWLESAGEMEGDGGYGAFFGSVDAMVMGRNTYELVMSMGVGWPYGKKPVFVLTSRALDVPEDMAVTVKPVAGTPEEIVNDLSDKGFTSLYIDGGSTIQQFLRAGLINVICITIIPVLIGEGIPLFGELEADICLKLLETKTFGNQVVQSWYKVIS